MLDPGVSETRGTVTDLSHIYQGSASTDPRPPGYIQAIQKKSTVKELLMMKRKANEQRMNCSQEDNNMEHKFKSAQPETFASDVSLYILGPPAPVNPNTPVHFPRACPENGHMTPEQAQHSAGRGQVDEVRISLFHWQIQQEAHRVTGVSPELLIMQDEDGDTCLHIAVAQGRRALSYVLASEMAKCGSLDMKEHNGQTALQIAAATNQHLIVCDLLEHGAQINIRDLWGRSPVHVCAEKGHFLSLQSICSTLMGSKQAVDIEMFNYDGLTPLHAAVLSHNEVIKDLRLLENPCSYMIGALMQRRQMFVECIETLLLMGAFHGTKDLKSGRTCLHMASEEANMELLQLFLNQPSSLSTVNVGTFSGNTALHIVSSLQNHATQVEAVKLLMRKGADPGTRNLENELPSQLVPEGPTGEKIRQILKGKFVHA